MSDITTTNMDVDTDISTSIPDSASYTGIGGGAMDILTPPITQSVLDIIINPGIVDMTGDHTTINFDSIASIVADGIDVDVDLVPSEPSQNLIVGPVGSVMSILLDRPIRNRLSDLIEPGFVADNTVAQFTDIAAIIATGMDVDSDLPMGSSGAWGALQTCSGILLNGTVHWSFDQFASEFKIQPDTEIEYISGSGISKYVMRGEDDPDAGAAGRDAEDFQFYDEPGDLRIQQLALSDQWNEINMQMAGGHGSTLDILIAMFL